MSIKLLTYDVYRSGMTLFKDLADLTYQDREHLPEYFMRAVRSGLPAGVETRYCLVYRVAGDPDEHMSGDYFDVYGSSGGGILQTYIVGETPYALDWLSDEEGGEPLIPTKEFLYLILTPGNMKNCFYRFDVGINRYVKVLEATGDGAVFSYEILGKTPLDSDWLTDVDGSLTPLVPKDCIFYIDCTPGRYQNRLFKYNATTTKYEVVSEYGSGVVFAYEVTGKTPFAADWLSKTSGGSSLTPYNDLLYLDMSPGKFNNFIFRFDTVSNKYVPISGGGSGVVFSREVSGKTAFNSDWLEEADGTAITPDPDMLYLDTQGKYKNFIFKYNSTSTKYEPVSCAGYGITYTKEVAGKTAFNSDWFSDLSNVSISPVTEMLYLDTSAGKYNNFIFRYNSATTKYEPISGSGGGVIFAKEVSGKTPLNSDWLAELDNTAITPDSEMLYLDTTVGKYENFLFRYDSTTMKYIPLSGSGTGVIYSYIVGNTAFASDWLSETVGGTALTPEEGPLYLILTTGQHYSAFYRYDETDDVYILVGNARVVDITKAAYLNLPQAKQNDGTIYFITDSASSTPGKDDYLPARVSVPENPAEGLVILWKGLVTGTFPISPAIYQYDGSSWVRQDLGIFGQVIQENVIPTPDMDQLGRVIQFTGSSSNGYVHNFFYECMYVSDSYRWVNVKVQTGDEIQVSTIPAASADLVGKVYQYIGASNANYIHGYFYECVSKGNNTYAWENRKVQPGERLQYDTMPAASAELVGAVFQYIGPTTSTYTHNYIYECVDKGNNTYTWENVKVQPGEKLQFDAMPAASADLLGCVYQYVGATDSTYTHNYIYECKQTGTNTYAWENVKVQPETKLQYDSLPAASADYLGKVFQYTGATNATYTHNYIYECVQSGSSYLWKQTNVQGSRELKNNGTLMAHREIANFTDFDIVDDSEHTETDIKAHRLTSAEFADIFNPAPVMSSSILAKPSVTYAYKRWLRFNPNNKKGIIIKGGTAVKLANGLFWTFASDTAFDLSSDLTTPGKDYFLFLSNSGNVSAVLTKGSGTGVYIGRLHTLCANAGTITMISPASPSSGITAGSNFLVKSYRESDDPDFYAFYNKTVTAVSAGTPYDVVTTQHPLSGFSAGDILPESVMCLTWRPDTRHEDAMVYDADTGLFADVYIQSGTGINTKSVYNATVTASRQQPNCMRDMQAVGKRLMFHNEFFSIAIGSNECTEIGTDSTTAGGHTDTNSRRMISAVGCEDCCGLRWQWLLDIAPVGGIDGGGYDGRNAFGKTYGTIPYGILAGGGKGDTTSCGSGSLVGVILKSTVDYPWSARGVRECI